MVRVLQNSMLVMLLVASLVICPYSCMNHPRFAGESRADAATACCPCGCHSSAESPTPEQKPDDSRRFPKSPCSCPCVCKGALSEFPGQLGPDEIDSTHQHTLVLLSAELPAVMPALDRPEGPQRSPPEGISGRQVRTLIASLLL